MKMTVKKLLFLLLAGVFLLYGCGSGNHANDTPSEEDSGKTADGSMSAEPGNGGGSDDAAEAICAMVLVDPGGNRYFIDVNAGTFFTAPIPEEFTNADGEMLEESDLSAGDLVEIYGNGIMLESYPGQYPGVSRMVLVQEGTEEDASQYQELIDQVYAEPDPSELPVMSVEYTTKLAVTSMLLSSGNYEWAYSDENGETQHVAACGSHILEWEELADARLEEPADLRLLPSGDMKSVEITRWPVSAWEAHDSSAAGEKVEAAEEEGSYVIKAAEPGYVYLIVGHWTEGYVEFGFYTQ